MHAEPFPRPENHEPPGGLTPRHTLRAHKGVIRSSLWSRDGQLDGTEHTAFPRLVRGRIYSDFRDDPAIAHLRESVGHQTMRLVA